MEAKRTMPTFDERIEPGAIGTVLLWRDEDGILNRSTVTRRSRGGIVTHVKTPGKNTLILADVVVRAKGFAGTLGMGQYTASIVADSLDDTAPTSFADLSEAIVALRLWLPSR